MSDMHVCPRCGLEYAGDVLMKLRAERDALRVAAQMVVQAHDDGEDMQSGIDMLASLLDAALAANEMT